MNRIRALGALVVGALATMIFSAAVLAYEGQVAGQVVVSGPDFLIACGYDWQIKAHITESGTGNPIEGQTVNFQLLTNTDAADALNPTSTQTNANGNAFTTLTVGDTPGPRTIKATADDVSGTFEVTCDPSGLPPTSVAESLGAADTGPFNWALLAAVGAVVAGFGIVGLRFARR